MDPRDCIPIPQPPTKPLFGNLFDLIADEPFQGLYTLSEKYGEIVRLRVIRRGLIFVTSYGMLNELCDENRFEKAIHPALRELRDAINDGLFTAYNDEANWGIAHRTLVPAFGPLNVAGMFESMKDIASQLVLKWLRHGSSHDVPVTQDFTRLTLDTIALCAMDYRFNSFYTEDTHPFVKTMVDVLVYPDRRGWVPDMLRPIIMWPWENAFKKNIKDLRIMARDLVQERIQNPKPDTNDLLNAMINGKDPKTGKGLDDESIVDNMLTFLIAGHETTSGMLSFTMYYLLKNKDAYQKVREEVDRVVGTNSVQPEHVKHLPYINAVLRESSRLQPTAPAFAFTPKNPEGAVLGGKYHVARGESVLAFMLLCHRDRAAYGEDAEEFRPERMLDENMANLPPNAWKTFGNGKRGCIGKGFAWQEMLLVMVMLFQHFDFEFVNPDYELKLDFTLTIKPKDLQIRAKARPNVSLSGASFDTLLQGEKKEMAAPTEQTVEVEGKPITILYGSNSGTCEVLARTLANDAASHGFKISTIGTLDSATRAVPIDEPVVIVTASYEGRPTDNATQFYEWLEDLDDADRLGSSYAIFGCGHSDWKQTFHRIPRTLDRMLEQHGGQRLCELGLADASKGDMMGDFQTWEDTTLWPALEQRYGTTPTKGPQAQARGIVVNVSSKRSTSLRGLSSEAKVLATKTLTGPGEPIKKHIVIELPLGTTYRSGDYCAILPFNPRETVHRVMTRFSLPFDTVLKLSSHMGTTLPDEPLSALDLFGAYVELSQPATRRDISMLIECTDVTAIQSALKEFLNTDFNAAITDKRISLLDLLEQYPSIQLPLGSFVASLIPMRVRQYSIASAPGVGPQKVTLIYDVLNGPATAAMSRHIGVASNYLSSLQPGDVIHASIKASHQSFHIPDNQEQIPIIMIAAGAGIAPFRGFIEERACNIHAGKTLAPAHLFFGCRGPTRDDLYRSELDEWEAMGAVMTHRAYSRTPALSGGYKHINEVLLAERKLLIDLWQRDAKVYVCGSRAVGESVKQAFLNIASEMFGNVGEDDAEDCMEKWFEGIRNQRYTTDVFT